MITPDEFPYIKSLYVNDCYTYRDFNIVLHDYQPFSHLILTGKNGSGKSTILRAINEHIKNWQNGIDANKQITILRASIQELSRPKNINQNPASAKDFIKKLQELEKINLNFTGSSVKWYRNKSLIVYSYITANRKSKVDPVSTVAKEEDFTSKLTKNNSTEYFVSQFRQYLVNKKVSQAFDQLNNDLNKVKETDAFFDNLTSTFRSVFEDAGLELLFIRENFDFLIKLSDGRQLTFDTLSEGFSALLSILMDLFMRVDLIRKQVGDFSYDPCGIVLIDEPETHLHLELQEQILPLLTSLFPNIQFIAATHSPAVIASIKQATIFDLTTKETRASEDTVGRSYSDLMRGHFGLNNEYSGIADEIINKVNRVLTEYADDGEERRAALRRIYDENHAYLSPTLKVELELLIAQQEAHQSATR